MRSGVAALECHDVIGDAVMDDNRADCTSVHRRFAVLLEAEADEDLGDLLVALEHRRAGGARTLDLARRALVCGR